MHFLGRHKPTQGLRTSKPRYSQIWRVMARYSRIWPDMAIYGQIEQDMDGLERLLFGDRFQPFLNRIFFGLERVLPYKMRIPMNRIFTRVVTCNSQKRVPT